MPNPTRPSFGEVIDETWGDLVADQVIRRYVNAAERDADLVGFTPADLAGQVIAIMPGAGVPPYLQQHDGAGWHSIPTIQGSLTGGMTDANGFFSISFPMPFRTVPTISAIAMRPEVGGPFTVMIYTATETYFAVQVWVGAAPYPNNGIQIQWIAMAPLTPPLDARQMPWDHPADVPGKAPAE
jgi:hypothetical protein